MLKPHQATDAPGRIPRFPELFAAIEHFIHGYNRRAPAFISTKTAEEVLEKAVKTRLQRRCIRPQACSCMALPLPPTKFYELRGQRSHLRCQ